MNGFLVNSSSVIELEIEVGDQGSTIYGSVAVPRPVHERAALFANAPCSFIREQASEPFYTRKRVGYAYVRTPIMRNAASGSRTMRRREKKRHEGRGVPTSGWVRHRRQPAQTRQGVGRKAPRYFRITLITAAGNSAIFHFLASQTPSPLPLDRSTRN